jgi:hypothetical protein
LAAEFTRLRSINHPVRKVGTRSPALVSLRHWFPPRTPRRNQGIFIRYSGRLLAGAPGTRRSGQTDATPVKISNLGRSLCPQVKILAPAAYLQLGASKRACVESGLAVPVTQSGTDPRRVREAVHSGRPLGEATFADRRCERLQRQRRRSPTRCGARIIVQSREIDGGTEPSAPDPRFRCVSRQTVPNPPKRKAPGFPEAVCFCMLLR